MALDLMDQHGLPQRGWVFRWGFGKRRLGSVSERIHPGRPTQRVLRLSTHLVRLNNESAVREVILHEIAHALVGLKHGHGPAWRAQCIKLGIPPRRLADSRVQTVPPSLSIHCGRCDRLLMQRHRRPSAAWLKRVYCPSCGPTSAGQHRLAWDAVEVEAPA